MMISQGTLMSYVSQNASISYLCHYRDYADDASQNQSNVREEKEIIMMFRYTNLLSRLFVKSHRIALQKMEIYIVDLHKPD